MNLEKIVRFGDQYFQEQTDGTFAEIERQAIVDACGHSGPTLVKVVDQLPLMAHKPQKEVSAKTEKKQAAAPPSAHSELNELHVLERSELIKMKRDQLNEIAQKLGVEAPYAFTNNFSLIKAIQETQNS